MPLDFFKYHGLGNDFILVEGGHGPPMTSERAVRLCDRRLGVGADGVLSLLPARQGGAAFMHIFNSDGSEALMCGNGIRCVARHLSETTELGDDLDIETASGLRHCRIHRDAQGRAGAVAVTMGLAHFEDERALTFEDLAVKVHRVSMGNMHAVTFPSFGADPVRASELAPEIERRMGAPLNVGFAEVLDRSLQLVVHEHGAGMTQACGTGACAAAAAAVKLGHLPFEEPLEVRLPGGSLEITIDRHFAVVMRGPAALVFEGTTDL